MSDDKLAVAQPAAIQKSAETIRAELAQARVRLEQSAQALRQDLSVLDSLGAWKKVVRRYPVWSAAAALAVGVALGTLLSRRD